MIWYHIIFPMQCTHDEAHPDDCFLNRSWSPKPGAITPAEEPTMDVTWVCHGQWLIFPMICSMFVDFHGCSWFVDFSINEFTGRCIQWISHGLFRYVFFLVTGEQLFSCVKPTHCATFSIYLPDLTRSYKPYFFFANSFGLSWWSHAFWPHRRIQAMMRSLCVTTTWLSRGPVAWWDDGWGNPAKMRIRMSYIYHFIPIIYIYRDR